jgi:hypothetical protein
VTLAHSPTTHLSPSAPSLLNPPLHKLLQIRPRRHAQHESARRVRHDGKVALLFAAAGALPRRRLEKLLELLERGLHRDDRVAAAAAAEASHGARDGVRGRDGPGRQLRLQLRDRDVAEQRARRAVDDRQVRVVALKRRQERRRDGVARVERERRGRLEVLDRGLERGLSEGDGREGTEENIHPGSAQTTWTRTARRRQRPRPEARLLSLLPPRPWPSVWEWRALGRRVGGAAGYGRVGWFIVRARGGGVVAQSCRQKT